MKARVDEVVCVGSGNCEAICPAVFKVVDGVSTVKVNVIPSDQLLAVRKAVKACPTGAITVE